VPRVLHLPDSRLAHITDLYTPEELRTSSAYNELMPQCKTLNSFNVRLDGPKGSHIAWVIADPVAPGGWASPQPALIKGFLLHIRQYVRVRQVLFGADALGACVAELLHTSRLGILHLDRHGRIVAANDRARAILRQRDGVVDRDGFLHARSLAAQARLARLGGLRRILSGLAAGGLLEAIS